MQYKQIAGIILSFLVLILPIIVAEKSAEIEEGNALVAAQADCSDLSDEELEAIGEYIMETMHPGEEHDAMHQMMGLEEGTLEHTTFHIGLAERMYCNRASGYSMGMMYGSMMSSGYGMTNAGMMGSWSGSSMMGYGTQSVVSLLYLVLLIGIVVLVILLIIKVWRSLYNPKQKR